VHIQNIPGPCRSRSRSYFTTDSQSVCLGVEHPCVTCDLVTSCRYIAVRNLTYCFCGAPSLTRGRVCNFQSITQWSESCRTHSHTSFSQLRLSKTGGPSSRIYIPQEQDGPVIPSGTELASVTSLDAIRYDFLPHKKQIYSNCEEQRIMHFCLPFHSQCSTAKSGGTNSNHCALTG
jgi:hypothetical protein